MQDALTLLSYAVVGYLIVPMIVLLTFSINKDRWYEQPRRGIFWSPVAMIVFCTILILLITLYRVVSFANF